MGFLDKIRQNYSTKEIKRNAGQLQKVLSLEGEYAALSDEALQAKTAVFKQRHASGEDLDALLPEAFAACREAAWRVLKMKHYPVQVSGGILLHQGRVAEMRTGEGKTLVATLPAYLNAIAGNGVHIVTVNDYLARRDSEWMGKIFRFMGLTVGLIVHDKEGKERRDAYAADITYGTNNEMGFDYLRDNMVQYQEQKVQRGHAFAIVDEVDSILIDEARTPLIISGQGEASTELYERANTFARRCKILRVKEIRDKQNAEDISEDADVVVDEKARSATLTAAGVAKAERFFGVDNLTAPENVTYQHHVNQAIRAWGVMRPDVDYLVKDGEVLIIDEFTGRIMYGRRYNEGLHQAIEAKEGVEVAHESKTLATITFQNYFRLYRKLSGMTGTAMTERDEFQEIYRLDVVETPTHKPMIRTDHGDVVYKTEKAKFDAVIEQILACHEKGQPVLVGTVSVERSIQVSELLQKKKIPHNVLNAKNHEREAEIIAQAGTFGSVTIATNMAGRGTDIVLGGNAEYIAKAEMRGAGFTEEMIAEATGYAETEDEEILQARQTFAKLEAKHKTAAQQEAQRVVSVGGLFIIGTERHESRRIDNQLRGRAGRQGDPGESRFYLSMEDDLLRLFGGERMTNVMNALNVPEDMPIEHKMITSMVENAQKKLEGQNFAQRKNVIKYDDVMNRQRELIYSQRNKVLEGEELKPIIIKMLEDGVRETVQYFCPASTPREDWLVSSIREKYGWLMREGDFEGDFDPDEEADKLIARGKAQYEAREAAFAQVDPNLMRRVEQFAMLGAVDAHWMEHIDAMEDLKRGIGLRAYAQQDPVVAYRMESFDMFDEMTTRIREQTVKTTLTFLPHNPEETERKARAKVLELKAGKEAQEVAKKPKPQPVKRAVVKVGPNDPCPCGSGLKYKKCCMLNDQK
ncbi:MAG: preprotein translocase subunit SecA [Oscillospiraceae bacterium]|jgi:preprotein translocase subunit SecA|nr:preprotein translocase subunit SecA [Oscillospiraceae bacterium]